MFPISKTLVFLCMLIGWSQAFPHPDVVSENEAMKDADVEKRKGQDVTLSVTDVTPPVCRVVNESSECLLSCGNTVLEVTYIMSDGNGSGINHTQIHSFGAGFNNMTQYEGLDENGYNAILLHYSGICCLEDLNVSAVDKAGNKGTCPVVVKRVTTTDNPLNTTES